MSFKVPPSNLVYALRHLDAYLGSSGTSED